MTTKKADLQKGTTTKRSNKKWSKQVTEHSNALSLEDKVFKNKDPKKIARSLKRSEEKRRRRKAWPFQSAMSMLNFYITRAGKVFSKTQNRHWEKAKAELR